MSNPKSSPTTTCQEHPNFSSSSIYKAMVNVTCGLAIGMVKCIVVGNLHKVSNVWRGPGKFLQSIHSDVDHIILIWEQTLAENLLDFKKKHFRPAYLLPCLTSQWLATTLVGCSCLGAWFLSEIFLIRKHLYSLAPTPVSLFVRSFVIVFD